MWSNLPRDLKILLISTILANTGGRMTRPFMPLYILALGGGVTEIGIFFTVNTLAAALLRPLGGWFSDRIGRLQAVAIGAVFSFGGQLGYALSPSWGWLLVAAIVMAFGRAVVGPSYQAFIAEAAPKGQTAQTFGLVNGLFTICQIIGPALGGWLAARYELRIMFWAAVVFMTGGTILRILPAFGLTFDWGKVQVSQLKQGLGSLWLGLIGGGLLTWLFITDSLRDVGVQLHDSLQSVLLETNGIDEAQIGLLFSLHAVVYLLVNLFGSRLADRWSAAGALALSGILHAVALGLLALSLTPTAFIAYFVLSATALALGDPAFDAFLAKATPPERLGLTFGIFSTAISIASAPAPYIGSLLWEGVTPVAPFVGGAVFLFVAGIVTWVVLGKLIKAEGQGG